MRFTRLAAVVALACGLAPAAASAQLPPGVDALASSGARVNASTIASPRLYTHDASTLLLAFVVAGGAAGRERVSRMSGDGLRWVPVSRSDGIGGATEVWSARARHWLSGRIVATLASAASPASITVVAYAGSAPYIAAHAAGQGRRSTPRIKLRPAAGSLVWTVGLSQGQHRAVPVTSASPNRRVLYGRYDRRRRSGAWVELATVRTSHVAAAAGASWSRSWRLASVDVVVPGLKRLIEQGLVTAFGAASGAGRRAGAATAASAVLPPNCPRPAGFEVGVQDDQVFFGLQPAMTPTRGFELASQVFHARLLRVNVDWGEFKKYGWAPYDQAVQMARERCWTVHMTIMWTPAYAESFLNNELSAHNLNRALLASFASEIATRYRGLVGRFAIGNEPNHESFMAQAGKQSEILARYDQMYMAGYDAIKAADPSAEVIAGEVSGEHIIDWLSNLAALPSSGVGVHPYGMDEHVREFVEYIAPVPLLISEDGVQVGTPHQVAVDLEKEELARRAGAQEFVFYQLSRDDKTGSFPWNTGIE